MNNPMEVRGKCIIVVAELFAKVNAQRKLLHRAPIENQAMATRCTLRFNVDKQRDVDFSAEKILISPSEIVMLENIINELFGVYFEGVVQKLCVKAKAPQPKQPSNLDAFMPHTSAPAIMEEKAGFLSRIKGLFGGK